MIKKPFIKFQKLPFADVFQKFWNVHRKTIVLELHFNEVAGLEACNSIKKRLHHRCFLVNIAKLLRTPILKNICKQLLLYF